MINKTIPELEKCLVFIWSAAHICKCAASAATMLKFPNKDQHKKTGHWWLLFPLTIVTLYLVVHCYTVTDPISSIIQEEKPTTLISQRQSIHNATQPLWLQTPPAFCETGTPLISSMSLRKLKKKKILFYWALFIIFLIKSIQFIDSSKYFLSWW